jgi:hypothetical protein
MTTHIAEYQTTIMATEEELADVIYLPSMPAVELGIEEVNNEFREIHRSMLIKREGRAIRLGVDDDELELIPSAAESQRLHELRRRLGELNAIRDSIADSIRVAREDKIREEEEFEYQYFTTVTIH